MRRATVVPIDGVTAKQRHAFYKACVNAGAVYCTGCRCYMFPGHACDPDWWAGRTCTDCGHYMFAGPHACLPEVLPDPIPMEDAA